MAKTKIDWADYSWNPTAGCKHVLSGCANCYAEVMAERLKNIGAPGYNSNIVKNGKWTGYINLFPNKLNDPNRWKNSGIVFVDSMSDLFFPQIPTEFIEDVFEIMVNKVTRHNYVILTKRPNRMRDFMEDHPSYAKPNIWLGISISNQAEAEKYAPILYEIIAKKRILSIEPFLGPIDFAKFEFDILDRIDWVICGSESGINHRPQPPIEDFISLKNQCKEPTDFHPKGIPFFLKQIWENGKMIKLPFLDGRIWDEIPI